MARRSEDWNVALAKDLRDSTSRASSCSRQSRQAWICNWRSGRYIRANKGVKEFAAKVCMVSPNVLSGRRPRLSCTDVGPC